MAYRFYSSKRRKMRKTGNKNSFLGKVPVTQDGIIKAQMKVDAAKAAYKKKQSSKKSKNSYSSRYKKLKSKLF
jgi:hypothetical protein